MVPLNFGYLDGSIYLHGAPEGKKMDMLAANGNVCVEFDCIGEFVHRGSPCSWGFRFSSAIGFGKARIVSDPEEKRKGLEAIAKHYVPDAQPDFPDASIRKTSVIRVDLDSVTGKSA